MGVVDRNRRRKIQREAEGYLELGLPRHALAALGRLGDPTSFDAHCMYLWGESLRALHRYDEALLPLEQAAQADPDNIHVWIALGWCYKRTGRLDMAIEALEAALIAQPEEALLHYNLSCYLSLAGKKQRSLEHLRTALEIEPEYRRLIDEEPDFDPLRGDPDFQALCQGQRVV